MKILVCISHVPDTTSKINFTDNDTKFDTNGVQFVINPYDEFVLTRAMMLKKEYGATVNVIAVGDLAVETTLKKAYTVAIKSDGGQMLFPDGAVRIDAVACRPVDATRSADSVDDGESAGSSPAFAE